MGPRFLAWARQLLRASPLPNCDRAAVALCLSHSDRLVNPAESDLLPPSNEAGGSAGKLWFNLPFARRGAINYFELAPLGVGL